MIQVLERLAEILAMPPHSVLPIESIGMKLPASGSDIPALALSATYELGKGVGLGRVIRTGNAVVQSVRVVEVSVGQQAFSHDLKTLSIWPLPIKQNPILVSHPFSEADLQINNVSDMSAPIAYRMVNAPIRSNEFKVDPPNARVIFGSPQTVGHKLELSHWTISWRKEFEHRDTRGSSIRFVFFVPDFHPVHRIRGWSFPKSVLIKAEK